MTISTDQAILDELVTIRKLMMLQLLAGGLKQKQLAAMIGVSEPTLSRMLPKGITKDVARGTGIES